jgi:SAM-dependent methyltransferase
MIESDLKKHLEFCGLRCLDNDEYWAWGGEALEKKLNDKTWKKFETLRAIIVDGKANQTQRLAFYDFIADKKIEHILHSMKFNAILESGKKVTQYVDQFHPKSILDFGCNTGLLTSWYAKRNEKISVTGVDISYTSIQSARNLSNKLKLINIDFIEGNYQKKIKDKFDLIADTQSIYEVPDRVKILQWISNSLLNENGIFISIPQAGNKEAFITFIREIISSGLYISNLEFISFQDLGAKGCYPVISAKKMKNEFKYDLDLFWTELYSYFSSLQ